jgi:hypothetical protein
MGEDAARKLLEIERLRKQANDFATALLPSHRTVFVSVSLPLPDVSGSAELAFVRCGSWLYVLLFESGRVGIRYLVQLGGRNPSYTTGDPRLELVHALRTWSQHNINLESQHDVALMLVCTTWFESVCGTRVPRQEDHWRQLLTALLDAAHQFLEYLLELLGRIEVDPDLDLVIDRWEQRLNRDWPAYRFHSLITEAASDLGRDSLDSQRYFERHGHILRQELQILRDDCDLERELRRVIESMLLSEAIVRLPITGRDLLIAFDMKPGPEVGRLLGCARDLYRERPMEREELLQAVRDSCFPEPAEVAKPEESEDRL